PYLLLQSYHDLQDLHSFPTRRSSDLVFTTYKCLSPIASNPTKMKEFVSWSNVLFPISYPNVSGISTIGETVASRGFRVPILTKVGVPNSNGLAYIVYILSVLLLNSNP